MSLYYTFFANSERFIKGLAFYPLTTNDIFGGIKWQTK